MKLFTPFASVIALSAPFAAYAQEATSAVGGIGANDFAMNVDPDVGIYLDGVYLALTVGANLDLPDVERFEVLKGPQGTPYVTDRAGSLPRSGYQTSNREGGQHEWTLRGKLLWEASDRFRVTIGGDHMKIDQSLMSNSVLAVTTDLSGPFGGTAANTIPGTAFDPSGASGFFFSGLYDFCIGSTAAELAARNASALCGMRGTSSQASRRRSVRHLEPTAEWYAKVGVRF